jgi:hypothetical protein
MAIADIARLLGMSDATLRGRWRRAGRPAEIGPEIAEKPVQRSGGHPIKVNYPPHGEVTFGDIRDRIHPGMGTDSFFRHRWYTAGRPEVVTADIFVRPLAEIDPEDDDNLAHIPKGDLCHLSGTKNTGAGKGEIPDEEWVKMGRGVRSIMAGMYRRVQSVQFAGNTVER